MACIARRLCSIYVNPRGFTGFVACRLIALDKSPGVGEVLQRVIGKTVLAIITDDIWTVVGTSCAWVSSADVKQGYMPRAN